MVGVSWKGEYWGNSIGSTVYATDDKYIGNDSLKVNKTNNSDRHFFSQPLDLVLGNTYTFSAYVKTSGVSNTQNQGAMLFIRYMDKNQIWQTASSSYINGTNDWQRVEFNFTMPKDASWQTTYVCAGLSGESGTAYFDNLQFEDGAVSSRYNLVENSWLNYSLANMIPYYWNKNSDCNSSDSSVTIDGKYAFTMNGEGNKSKNLSQTINISGKQGDVFTLTGWAKGNSVPLNDSAGRYFALDIGIQLTNGTWQWGLARFNMNCTEWQYASDRIIANGDYSSITYYIIYYNNSNTVYFTDLQLYREEFGNSYQYDSKGNVTSTQDLAHQNSKLEYTNNDLTKLTDPKGNSFIYVYDKGDTTKKNHNLTSATSAENVVYSFDYDSSGNPITAMVGNSALFIKTAATYTPSGNYINTVTDSIGNTTTYNYDETKGVLNNIVDAKNKNTSYSYDSLDRLTGVSKTVDGLTVSNGYNYENDRIKSISNNGVSYSFGYDSLGNNTVVSVGTQNLITNKYEDRTSRLLSSTYGNGQIISNKYDNLDRVTEKSFNNSARYRYTYDNYGNLGYIEDLNNGVNYRYIYDTANRLTKIQDTSGNMINYSYDSNNNLNNVTDKVNNNSYLTTYSFDKDNRPVTTTFNRITSNTITNVYDAIGRLNNKSINTGVTTYNVNYNYKQGSNGSTSDKVSVINNNGSSISYTYDANGNIETINQNGQIIGYQYNEANELIREDNPIINKTIKYAYDAGGNITTRTEYPYTTGSVGTAPPTVNYSYGDNNWKDKLTNYNGLPITYDAIGNPISYNGWSYQWEEGRQLQSLSNSNNTISYKYNDQGLRTQKVVNGVTTKYHLVGDKVTFETNGSDNVYYTYDSSDNLVSMNLNGVEYYYIRNTQGDIIGLFDKNGTQVVSYVYDSWGKLISTTGTLASTVGVKNPYRYRG